MPAYPPDTNLEHTRETDGYDGVRKGVRWWFEAWNIKGGMVIGTTPSKANLQQFWSPDGTTLYAVNLGVINQ